MKKIFKKAYKYRLKPTREQREKFAQYAGAARYVYNDGLAKIKSFLNSGFGILSYNDLADLLPFMKLCEETKWLKDSHSQVLQQSLLDLHKGIKNFFEARKKGKKGWFPKFKCKGKKDSFRYPQNIKCENGKVWLPKIGWVGYRDSRPIEGTITQATIKRKGQHWFISIHTEFEVDVDLVPVRDEEALGIDVGISCYAATSNGEKIPNPAYLYNLLGKLRYLYRELSRKKKFSKNWKKCVGKIQRLHIRITNLRDDFLHKLSTKIAENQGVVCVEDLNIKGMVRNGRLSRSISDAAWGKFYAFLRYKCEWLGKHFVQIERFFPSSKLCSSCGVKKDMPLHIRIYSCDSCGLELDRDVNASINIMAAGLSVLKACGEVDSGQLSETRIAGF